MNHTAHDETTDREHVLTFFWEPPDRSVGIPGGYELEEVDGDTDRSTWPACALDPKWVEAAWIELLELAEEYRR